MAQNMLGSMSMRHSVIRSIPGPISETFSSGHEETLTDEGVRSSLLVEWRLLSEWCDRNGSDDLRDIAPGEFLEAMMSLRPDDIWPTDERPETPTVYNAIVPPPLKAAV